jgi:hypothetical protein
MMMGVEILVVGVSGGSRASAPRSEIVGSSECLSGTFFYDLVTSKYPCWSSFCLSGGGGGSSVTDGRPRSLRD